nr:hypothetical protein [uncultured Butyrivibrio sp.]
MKWYVYYKDKNGKLICDCFLDDEKSARTFAERVGGDAYMGF